MQKLPSGCVMLPTNVPQTTKKWLKIIFCLSFLDKHSSSNRAVTRKFALQGSMAPCELLLLNGAKVDRKDANGRSALHHATVLGHTGYDIDSVDIRFVWCRDKNKKTTCFNTKMQLFSVLFLQASLPVFETQRKSARGWWRWKWSFIHCCKKCQCWYRHLVSICAVFYALWEILFSLTCDEQLFVPIKKENYLSSLRRQKIGQLNNIRLILWWCCMSVFNFPLSKRTQQFHCLHHYFSHFQASFGETKRRNERVRRILRRTRFVIFFFFFFCRWKKIQKGSIKVKAKQRKGMTNFILSIFQTKHSQKYSGILRTWQTILQKDWAPITNSTKCCVGKQLCRITRIFSALVPKMFWSCEDHSRIMLCKLLFSVWHLYQEKDDW